MPGKRDDWLSKPPTAALWLVVIGIAVVIGVVFMVHKSTSGFDKKLDGYCREQAQLERDHGLIPAAKDWRETCKNR